MLLLLFLGCVGAYNTIQDQYTMNLEIYRQKTTTEQLLNYGEHLEDYFQDTLRNPPRDNDSIALYQFLDNEFYGQVVVGHPGQIFNVAFDASWSLSWLTSSKCSSIKAVGCWFHNKYDHSKSSEYKPDGRPFFMNMGKSNLTGFYSYDNISIAHSNVTRQSFVEMVSVPNEFAINKADGVLGLGLKTDTYDPFFYTLYNQKKIRNPMFSIYLNRDKQSNRGGNIMLGFVNPKHIRKVKIGNKLVADNFTYLAVENHAYWQFQMDKLVVDGNHSNIVVCGKGCKAIVDTSGNTIVGPQEEVDKIHDAMNAREFFLHKYTVDCDTVNKLPKIDFILAGKNFTLSGPEYTVKMSMHSVTLCVSAFSPGYTLEEQSRWVLGGAFLSKFYSVYNIQDKTIGFVQAI